MRQCPGGPAPPAADAFFDLLCRPLIAAAADARSGLDSRRLPHFNGPRLAGVLPSAAPADEDDCGERTRSGSRGGRSAAGVWRDPAGARVRSFPGPGRGERASRGRFPAGLARGGAYASMFIAAVEIIRFP